jgi:endoglucanase
MKIKQPFRGRTAIRLPSLVTFWSRIERPARLVCIFMVLTFPAWSLSTTWAELRHTGVNLSGAEFGNLVPGTFGIDYTYPAAAEVDYFIGKGMNTFRIPFRWERLQRSLHSELNATELSRMNTLVSHATDKGAYVVLDPHNFARYYPDAEDPAQGLVGSDVPDAAFADFWSRVAQQYQDNPRVIFNLVNEPNTMPTEQWLSAANAAIAGIRAVGAQNLILVPGNAWSGAWTWQDDWYGKPNAQVMLDVVDPINNYAYDVHQYLDVDGSGSFQDIVSATIGSERLSAFTGWLRDHDRRGFLGEWAVPRQTVGSDPGEIGDEAMTDLLGHLEQNDDVWLGWTWWSAGPWWGEYQFTLEPTPGRVDRPQMLVLEPHLAGVRTLNGDFDEDGDLDARDVDLLSQTIRQGGSGLDWDLDGDGQVDSNDRIHWVAELKQTYLGDSNLDDEFNSADLVTVLVAGEYEDTIAGNSGWAEGDWDGDGEFTSSDLIAALTGGGYEQGPRAAAAAVPEPSGPLLVALSLISLLPHRRVAR